MYSIADAARAALGIHSPSKVFAAMGENMALGIVEGWKDEFGAVKRDISKSLNFDLTPPAPIDLTAYASSYAPGEASDTTAAANATASTVVNIYSPKAVDPVQAAREWKKTTQQLAMGF